MGHVFRRARDCIHCHASRVVSRKYPAERRGELYGMSFMNGAPENRQPANGAFRVIDVGLPPQARVIALRPIAGAPGSTFLLPGSHFVGTSQVTINGNGARFKQRPRLHSAIRWFSDRRRSTMLRPPLSYFLGVSSPRGFAILFPVACYTSLRESGNGKESLP